MEYSKRLQAIAGLVQIHGTLADVGCDHAYLPIFLISQGKIERAIAADVHDGPLLRAERHIRIAGYSDRIEVRKSDGLANFRAEEFDTLVIAGMGGPLIGTILSQNPIVAGSAKEWILSPHSETAELRTLISERCFGDVYFHIEEEVPVEEDGKYYRLIRYIPRTERQRLSEAERFFGKNICPDAISTYLEYMHTEEIKMKHLLTKLNNGMQNPAILQRIEELEHQLTLLQSHRTKIME